jgi:hypothetical protein
MWPLEEQELLSLYMQACEDFTGTKDSSTSMIS